MSSDAHLNELGNFLKERRAELSPRTVGLPDTGGPRRVPGLRREEVALLAAISTDYYTRLEQGRIQPSPPVLAALVRVLHLNNNQRDHLFELAGRKVARPRRQAAQRVQPQLRRLLDGLTATPGMVIGRRMDILAWNPLAAALLTDFAKVPETERNYVRILFTDPAMRTLYADWRTVARESVSRLRTLATRYPDDLRLTSQVGELSVQDKDFVRWWGSHHVASRSMGTKKFHHPVAGELVLDREILTCGKDPDQELVVWTAEPNTPSYDGLRVLASWASLKDGKQG
ncbi:MULTISPECIES: helix-turn-helix domain-containing protein [Streptomyces]|uniref:helix-turn-helix domain-containing protein n=1 Tax=Streptomyces TaxID=1883 RepID=UPI00287FD20A|nr:helix-turn-helix domain-containing protein [Streptomyces sp. CGMCC 4.1456]WNF67627.1 helix-turn-helix domain-containing protein [Streptomyces sp. CGMCC 4.1456]